MRAEGKSHVVDAGLRAGYRYLRWRDTYRPLLGACLESREPWSRRDEILGFTTPLCAASTPPGLLERMRARAAESVVPLLVTACAGRLPASPGAEARLLRNLVRLAPGQGVIVDLVNRPRFAPSRLSILDQQLRFEEAAEALARRVRAAVGSHIALTISQDTVDPGEGPLPRFFYRAVSFPMVDLRAAHTPHGLLTRALLGVVHDRPALAVCGAELAASAAMLSGHGAVLRAGAWSPAGLQKLLRHSPREWTDPAQEPVAILLPEADHRREARRVHREVEQLVAVLHGRLRLGARIASELDPLALDKQELIVVVCPGQVSRQGALLVARQLQRGRRVVAWAPRRAGLLAPLPLVWSSRPEVLLELAADAGALARGSRLGSGASLQRTLVLGSGRLTGRLGPGRGRSSLRWQ